MCLCILLRHLWLYFLFLAFFSGFGSENGIETCGLKPHLALASDAHHPPELECSKLTQALSLAGFRDIYGLQDPYYLAK